MNQTIESKVDVEVEEFNPRFKPMTLVDCSVLDAMYNPDYNDTVASGRPAEFAGLGWTRQLEVHRVNWTRMWIDYVEAEAFIKAVWNDMETTGVVPLLVPCGGVGFEQYLTKYCDAEYIVAHNKAEEVEHEQLTN